MSKLRYTQLRISHLLLQLVLVSFTSHALAEKDEPKFIPGTTKVTAEEVLDLATEISDLIIVDSRIHADRKQGYIEGSVSLPDLETNCASLAGIIPRKISPVLFYCNGIKCGRSVIASKIALGCGYKNIYWFRGGFSEWQGKKYPFVKE